MEKIMRRWALGICKTLLAGMAMVSPLESSLAEETAPAETASTQISMADLEKLVARIALFPDPLVAQILPASTYPMEIVQAARWVEDKKGLAKEKPEEFKKQIEQQKWEASVEVVAQFPDALKMLNDDLDWTQSLGEAFLAQPKDLMNAIQRMRARAHANGVLKDSQQQTIIVEKEVIKIVPSDPEVIYVPSYNPQVVYVTEGHSDEKLAATAILSFGVGLALGAALSNDCDWDHCHVFVHGYPHYGYCHYGHVSRYHGGNYTNISRNTNISGNTININTGNTNNINRANIEKKYGSFNGQKVTSARNPATRNSVGGGQWSHNPEHRMGQSYKNPSAFEKARQSPSTSRARLNDSSKSGWSSGRGDSGPGSREGGPAGRDVGSSRPSANKANSGAGAFGGMDTGRQAARESSRGRQSQSRSGGGGGGSGGGRRR